MNFTFNKTLKTFGWPLGVFVSTTFFYVILFPPFNFPEVAFIFAIPVITWALWRPKLLPFAITAVASGFVSWLILIWWLRHVTWVGMTLLSFVTGMFWAAWALAAWWVVPRIVGRPYYLRIMGLAGLAGVWVLLEWSRTFFLSGFPWLPLAASQWQRPAMLQIISYTGSYGISFVLIFFNLGIVFYVRQIMTQKRTSEWWRRLCPEFYCALSMLLGAASMVIWQGFFEQDHRPMFRAGMIQPYTMQPDKWDSSKADANLATLERQTLFADALGAELIVWPETVTPWPVKGHQEMRRWTEELMARLDKPALIGNLALQDGEWHNAVFVVSPRLGVLNPYYRKRKLVPFGEYVPFQRLFPFIKKFVPIEGSFVPGNEPEVLPLEVGGRIYHVGSLICYEDIFPALARESVKAGADFLFVATNNAWYGEEGGAYQHAAHSVLRAVETRRPVLRCGNAGWSGWIDEFGNVRKVMLDPSRGVYFRGTDIIAMSRDHNWTNRLSFYTRYGDWFVAVCAVLSVLGFISIKGPQVEVETYRPGKGLFSERDS